MTFAEKLVFLMNLTSTSNKQLAVAANVDPSLISMLRTGRRDAPRNIAHTRAMAGYFARKCEGNYRRVALSEAMGTQLRLQMETEQLSSLLFDWLTNSRNQVGQFLHTFERLPLTDAQPAAGAGGVSPKLEQSNYVYYGSEGKRGAVDAFVSHLLTLDEPGTVLLSTDESLEWLTDDKSYLIRLQESVLTLLQRGFRVVRIASPMYTTEQAFDTLSQLLPMYLTGQVESYYYPRLRDNVYRRTVAVLSGVAAVVSHSIGFPSVSRSTMFTCDARLTAALADEFHDYLNKCLQMMATYTTAENPNELLRCILQFENDRGDRIQQSTSLSSITTPPELIRVIADGLPPEEGAAVIDMMSRAQALFDQSLEEYETVDIHSIPTVDEVRSGAVPIAASYFGREPVYYTPETYALHLRSILGYLERHTGYRAVLHPRDALTHALMVKDGRQAILLRPAMPLTAFEVSQPYIAEACREYLARLIESPFSPETQRQRAILQLRQMLLELGVAV